MFGIDSKSYPTSINIITPHMHLCLCRGVRSINTCITLNTHATPLNKTIIILHLVHPFAKVDFPPFVDDFHPKIMVILNWEDLYLPCTFTIFFFRWPSSMVYELYETVLSQMILWMASTFFSRYVGTLFEVMFHLQYHICFFTFQLLVLEK